MSHALVYLRPSRIAFVRATGPYETSIPDAWAQLNDWINRNGYGGLVHRGYGMCRDNPMRVDPATCRYDACIELLPQFDERAARELNVATLPGGSYARRRYSGPYAALRAELAGIHASFEPSAGLKLDDRRPLVAIYLENPSRVEAQDLRADICIPVVAITSRDVIRDKADVSNAA